MGHGNSNSSMVSYAPKASIAHPSADQLMPLVYDQLRNLAGSYLKREKRDQLLEPSVLVHETYLRLVDSPGTWIDQSHFLAIAAFAMRRVLVDHVRKRRALKRGFGHARVSLDSVDTATGTRSVGIREIDEALLTLEREQPRRARVVELRFFAGLNHEQIAVVLGLSRKTVVADWGKARDWLAQELSGRAKKA